jgi:hypothetical protein
MSTDTRLDPSGFVLRLAFSAVHGLLLYGIYYATTEGVWPGNQPAVFFPLLSLLLVLPGTYYLTADLARARGYAIAMAGMAVLLLVIGVHQGAISLPHPNGSFFGNEAHHFAYAVAIGAIWLHGLPFVQSWLATGRARPEYATLFQLAWRNCLLVALAAVFTGAFWLLLGLWAQLFKSIDIRLFADLFTSAKFVIPATAVAAGIGVQLAGSVENLQGALRRQLLTLFKWLAPLAALIVGLFSIALLMKSGALFAQGRSAIEAGWLLSLVVANIYLLNAAYQDGSGEAPYPHVLGALVRFSIPLLAAIAVLAMWALGVRIAEYGLTVERVWGLLVAVVALSYSLGYAWAAFRPGAWMARMGSVNVCMALVTAALLALMLTPVLSPSRLVAASQEARILERDRGFEDSFSELAFESDSYGRRRLEHLAKSESGPDAADVRKRAAAALMAKTKWDLRAKPLVPLSIEDLVFNVFPAGRTVPDELKRILRDTSLAGEFSYCSAASPCALLYVDLSGDGVEEAVVLSEKSKRVYTLRSDAWTLVGNLSYKERISLPAMIAALEAGNYRPREPLWWPLEVDGKVMIIELPWDKRHEARPAH